MFNNGSKITSGGGNVSVTGQAGGTGGASTDNIGVDVDAGMITAGSNGTVTIQGTGGAGGGTTNIGVSAHNNGTITSSGGDVFVTGHGGGIVSSRSSSSVVCSMSRITGNGRRKLCTVEVSFDS